MSALFGRSRALGAIVALVSSLVLSTMTAGVASANVSPVAAAQTVGVGATSAYNVTVSTTGQDGGSYYAVTAVSGVTGVSVANGGCTQVNNGGGGTTLAASLSLTTSVATGTYNAFQVSVGKFASSTCTGAPSSTTTITASTLTVDNYQIVFYKRYCSTYTRVPSNQDPTGGYTGWLAGSTDNGGHNGVLGTDASASSYDHAADGYTVTATDAGACTTTGVDLSGWTFGTYGAADANHGGSTTTALGTATTDASGTATHYLNGTEIAHAQSTSWTTGLFIAESTRPTVAEFGSSRCYNDVHYSDNEEDISGVATTTRSTTFYCVTYNVKQVITFGAAPTGTTVGATGKSVSATSTSGLVVAYTSLTPTVCTVNATTGALTLLAAGTCTIQADQAGKTDATDYWSPAASVTQDIAVMGTSHVTVGCPASVTYDGSAHTPCSALVYDSNNVLIPGATATPTYSANTNVGTVNVSATWAGDATHSGSTGTGSFLINPATPVITVTCTDHVYTGSAILGCSAVENGPGIVANTSVPMTSYSNNVNVGTATGTANVAATGNYAAATGSNTFKITPAAATCTVTPYTVTFDNAAHTAATGACTVGGVTVTGTFTLNTTHTNVGTYSSDTWSFTSTDGNYTASGTIHDTITPATPVVTVTCLDHVYTGSAILGCTAVENGPGIVANTSVPMTSYSNNVNVGTATGTANVAATGNYAAATGSKTFQITKATADCSSVTGYSVPFDSNSHTATGQCLGVDGLLLAGLDLSGTTHTAAGTYSDFWSFTDGTGNYENIVNHPITDSIGRLNQTITFPPLGDKTYGDPTIDLTGDATTTSPLPITYTVSGDCTLGLDGVTVTLTGAGTCTVTAQQGGDGVYNPAPDVPRTFTIDPATPVITVTCTNHVYTGSAIETCTAVENGPGIAANTSVPMTGYTNNVNVGTATGTVTLAATGNYGAATGSGTFKITPATASCSVSAYNVTYDGNAHMADQNGCTGIGGGELSGTFDLSGTDHTNVGDYKFDTYSFTSTDGNYTASGTVVDHITPATASCSVTVYNVVFDNTAHTASGGACTGIGGDTVDGTYDMSGTEHTNVGDYTSDTWSFTSTDGNYIATATITDTITAATPAITVTCLDSVYTGSAIETCTAVENGPGIATDTDVTASIVYLNNVNFGTASGTVTLAATGNYGAATGTGTFQITPATPVVTVHCTNQVYTGSAIETCTAVENGPGIATDTDVTSSIVYTNNVNVGTATATVNLAATGNYAAATGSSTFEITPAAATCSVTAYDVVFNNAAHAAIGGACTGIDDAVVKGAYDMSGTSHTNVGDYTSDTWSFTSTDGNYTATATIHDAISVATPVVTVSCTDHVYTGVAILGCTAVENGPGIAANTSVPMTGYTNNVHVGTATGTATVAATGNYAAASGSNTFQITPANQTITFAKPADRALNAPDFNLTATASSGLPVTYTVNSGPCTVTGATVHLTGTAGTCSITASQSGNADYNAAPSVTQTFGIGKLSQTITFVRPTDVKVDAAPFNPGATASSGLPVTYTVNKVLGVDSSCTIDNTTHLVTITGAGFCSLTASQAGDATYNPASPNVTRTFLITKYPQTITFDQDLPDVVFGVGPITLTATASSGLPVSYTTTGPCSVSSEGILTVTGRSLLGCTIWASQSGNDTYYPADPVRRHFAIDKAPQVITFPNPGQKTYGDAPFALGATAPGGPVTYTVGSGTCTVNAAGTLTIHGVGDCTIVAHQGGNAQYFAAPDVSVTFTVVKADSTVTVSCPVSVVYNGSAQTPACTATASGPGMADVDVTSSITFTNNTSVGAATANASWGGDANHNGSTGSTTFQIVATGSKVTVTCPDSVEYTGYAQTLCTAEATGDGMAPVNVTDSIVYTANKNPGTATADASWGGSTTNGGSSGSGSFTITKAKLDITANDQSKTVGTVIALGHTSFHVTGLLGGDTVATVDLSSTGSGAGAAVGTYPIVVDNASGSIAATPSRRGVTPAADPTLADVYDITYHDGTLTVTDQIVLTVKANNITRGYKKANPTLTYTITGYAPGDDESVVTTKPVCTTTAKTSSLPGTYQITCSGADSDSGKYTFNYVNGTLTVKGNVVGGETAPVTATTHDSPLNGDSMPLFALLISLAFGGLGLLAVAAQRKATRA